MTETVFGPVTRYGAFVVFASAFLSCLALPIPTSLMMPTAGAAWACFFDLGGRTLGPWVNFAARATGLSWRRFSTWDVLGEAVWVAAYVGLGYVFMDQISLVAEVMSDLIGLVVALVTAIASSMWIRGVLRAKAAVDGKRPVQQARARDTTP